jgi:hypothetical protein
MTEYTPQPIVKLRLPGTLQLVLAIAIPVAAALAAVFGGAVGKHALQAVPDGTQPQLVAGSLMECLRAVPNLW